MKATRRKYSREFKIEAVRMITERGLPVIQVARDLGIDRSLLDRWQRQLAADPEHAFPGKGQLKPMEEELRRLRLENETLRMEREILKKATAFFAKQSR
jgi:transposase